MKNCFMIKQFQLRIYWNVFIDLKLNFNLNYIKLNYKIHYFYLKF